jgi:enoyl-CoA hydratase
MTYQNILVEVTDGIATITINRPDKLNALNKFVFDDLEAALKHLSTENSAKAIIITGAGEKAFVAGADISEFNSLSREDAISLSQRGQAIFATIENSSKPIVAAVNGFALGGGCELAMACHFRLCSENAKFGQPEVNLGLIAGYGGTQRLTKIVGKGKSMEWQMTGRMIGSAEALSSGLVNYVVPSSELITKTREILKEVLTKAPVAISKLIECINTSDSTAENGYEKEVNSFADCFTTKDMIEGTSAFLEKRKPVFKGE